MESSEPGRRPPSLSKFLAIGAIVLGGGTLYYTGMDIERTRQTHCPIQTLQPYTNPFQIIPSFIANSVAQTYNDFPREGCDTNY